MIYNDDNNADDTIRQSVQPVEFSELTHASNT